MHERMSLLTKGYKFVIGFFFFLIYSRKLDIKKLLDGKRIAIIGAANSIYEKERGDYIDKFDVVIRVNKAPQLLKDGKWEKFIGSKCDILFHSFYENQQSGGGPIDIDLYDKLGIKFLVNPIVDYSGKRVTFNFYKKYLLRKNTYSLDKKGYQEMKRQLKQFQPTIGTCALLSAMDADFSELYITGFTFFKTAFAEGYRDDIKEAHQAQKFLKQAGLHNPDLEFNLFLGRLRSAKNKKVVMDDALTSIVAAHSV